MTVYFIRCQSQPVEISCNAVSKLLGGAFEVGIVKPEYETTALLAREQPVQDGRAGIADMYAACR